MATKKDAIRLTDEDFESKSFKTAPGGKYALKPNKAQSKIKPGNDGNIMQLVLTIAKGPHKGTNIFDNIAPHVGWKIAQLLKAFGISKKAAKKYKTIQDILKLVLSQKEINAVIKETRSSEFGKQNKIVQYLPPGADADEEDDDVEDEDDEEDADDSDEADEEEEDDSDEEESDGEEGSDEDDDEESDEEDDDDEEEESDDDEEDSDEEEDDDEEEEEEDEEEDEDEEDEEEEMKPKRGAKKKAAAKKTPAKKTAKKKKKRK